MIKIFKFFFCFFIFCVALNVNFKGVRKVVGKEIYISPQPNKVRLLKMISKYKINTVINLRGENEGKEWYEEERNILEQNDIFFLNFRFSKDRPAPRYEFVKLLNNFKNIKLPVLIHCRGGVDRSNFFLYVFMKLNGIEMNNKFFPKPKIWGFLNDFKQFCKKNGFEENSLNLAHFIKHEWVPDDFRYDLKTEVLNKESANKGEILFLFEVVNRSKKGWQFSDDLKKGMRLGGKLFGPLESMPENLEDYFYKNESKGVDLFRAGMIKDKVMPQERKDFYVNFKIPSVKGTYFLAIDMVDENVNWFYYYGKPPYFYCFEVF